MMSNHLAVYLTAALAAAVLWLALVLYSRRTYPWLSCTACGGSGKDFEPLLFAWLCLRRRRAWRPCRSCNGSAKRERRKR